MHKCELTPKAALFPTAPGVGAARPLISVTFSQAQGSDLGAGGTPRCQADGQRPQPAHTQLLPPACLSLRVRAPDHCPGAGVLDGYKTMLPRHLGGGVAFAQLLARETEVQATPMVKPLA